jgi:glutamate formiminotransferase
MPVLTIPNVSEGRDAAAVSRLSNALSSTGCRLLDVHIDPAHNRSVFTATGSLEELVGGTAALAREAVTSIDLREHDGVHPRVGALDVCPFVPHGASMDEAVGVARAAGDAIAQAASVPVYFYDHAASAVRRLPDIRAGGLEKLIDRARRDFPPDIGSHVVDARTGVVCVGARDTLVAFNVYVKSDRQTVSSIARAVRERDGGLPGVRALGIELDEGLAQVSMNLTEPARTGIDEAFRAVAALAGRAHVAIVATELVGPVPDRYLPDPDAQAARLLLEPGRSLESVLAT